MTTATAKKPPTARRPKLKAATPPAEDCVIPTALLPTTQLRDLVANAVATVSRDAFRPILTCALVEVADDGEASKVIVTSTSSYQLLRQTMTLEARVPTLAPTMFEVRPLAAALRLGGVAELRLTSERVTVTFDDASGETWSRASMAGEFPNVDPLINGADTPATAEPFALGAATLKPLAAVRWNKADVDWRLRPHGEMKPIHATATSGNWSALALLMPVRV